MAERKRPDPDELLRHSARRSPGHESARTAGLSDRRGDEIALDEVERIEI